jgi:CRISPR-associated protein Cas2
MVTLVVYDIPDDRLRERVATACKDLGLRRIQYSAFAGYLPFSRRGELELRVRRILGVEAGNIRLFPLCERDLALAREVSTAGYRPWR